MPTVDALISKNISNATRNYETWGGIIYNVKAYGAKGDGVTDDTSAIQSAINAMDNGDILFFPNGTYKTTSTIQISKSIMLKGTNQYQTYIIAVNCSGIKINKKWSVSIRDMEIALSTRYTTTPNSYIGIDIDGDTTNRAYHHIYQNVYIDGFETAIKCNYLWSSKFDNVECGYSHKGIDVYGLSVNNVITNCSFGVDGTTNSRGIIFAGDTASEGWMISNTLINGAEVGIHGAAMTHVLISNCILDHNQVNGILIQDNGSNFGGNWNIQNCYIAMDGASGDTGVKLNNNISNSQIRGNRVIGNTILTYSGDTCNYGVRINGTEDKYNLVSGNTIQDFAINDIKSTKNQNTIANNHCLSSVTNNIQGGDLIANNEGTVYYERSTTYSTIGKMKITYDQDIPTTGTWNRGDICYNVTATAGGKVGWVCTAAGSPGTWKAFGVIDA